MLNEFLFTKIEEENIGNIWFQQDGATCHTGEATLDVLRPVFEDRMISRVDWCNQLAEAHKKQRRLEECFAAGRNPLVGLL